MPSYFVDENTLAEALRFMTRKELAELEAVTKKFHPLIWSMPQRHIVDELNFHRNNLWCMGTWNGLTFPTLEFENINIDSVHTFYVKFQSVRLDNFLASELNLRWLRKFGHAAFEGCYISLGMDEPMDEPHKAQMDALLDLFTGSHQIDVGASLEPEEQRDTELKAPAIVKWLHSGGLASRVVPAFEFGGRTFDKFKVLQLIYPVNRDLYTELWKEITDNFLADSEEHPYVLAIHSDIAHRMENKTYADVLENTFTGEELRYSMGKRRNDRDPVVRHIWRRNKKKVE